MLIQSETQKRKYPLLHFSQTMGQQRYKLVPMGKYMLQEETGLFLQ